MDNFNVFTNKDVAKDGKRNKKGRKGALVVKRKVGDVIHLQPVGNVAYTFPVAIPMGNYNYLPKKKIRHQDKEVLKGVHKPKRIAHKYAAQIVEKR